jgi:hypothetical protein
MNGANLTLGMQLPIPAANQRGRKATDKAAAKQGPRQRLAGRHLIALTRHLALPVARSTSATPGRLKARHERQPGRPAMRPVAGHRPSKSIRPLEELAHNGS